MSTFITIALIAIAVYITVNILFEVVRKTFLAIDGASNIIHYAFREAAWYMHHRDWCAQVWASTDLGTNYNWCGDCGMMDSLMHSGLCWSCNYERNGYNEDDYMEYQAAARPDDSCDCFQCDENYDAAPTFEQAVGPVFEEYDVVIGITDAEVQAMWDDHLKVQAAIEATLMRQAIKEQVAHATRYHKLIEMIMRSMHKESSGIIEAMESIGVEVAMVVSSHMGMDVERMMGIDFQPTLQQELDAVCFMVSLLKKRYAELVRFSEYGVKNQLLELAVNKRWWNLSDGDEVQLLIVALAAFGEFDNGGDEPPMDDEGGEMDYEWIDTGKGRKGWKLSKGTGGKAARLEWVVAEDQYAAWASYNDGNPTALVVRRLSNGFVDFGNWVVAENYVPAKGHEGRIHKTWTKNRRMAKRHNQIEQVEMMREQLLPEPKPSILTAAVVRQLKRVVSRGNYPMSAEMRIKTQYDHMEIGDWTKTASLEALEQGWRCGC